MRYLTLLIALLLGGCKITIEHTADSELSKALTNTNSVNEVEYEKCRSASFERLLNLEKINVAKYKQGNDVNGLLNASFRQHSLIRMLLELSKEDIDKCLQLKQSG